MARELQLLCLYGAALATSAMPFLNAYATEPSKSSVAITSNDLPENCDLPIAVPGNLTSNEYFELLTQYARWQLPIQARQCVAKLRVMKLDERLKVRIDRLVDTSLPKQTPPVEAILLNLKAKSAPEVETSSPSMPFVASSSSPSPLPTTSPSKGRYAKGIEICNRCIEKYPNFEYGYMTLADYYSYSGHAKLASDAYRKVLSINPHNTQALVDLAQQQIYLNQFKEAKKCFEEALKYDPDDMNAQSGLWQLPAQEKRANANPLQQAGSFISTMVDVSGIPSLLSTPAALIHSGFIDKSGKFLYRKLECTQKRGYFNGLMFDDGHFFDKRDKPISDKKFEDAEDFSEGVAAVCENKKWGFLGTTGKLVIAPKYQDARSFREGLAAVKVDGHWGFIDKTGKLMVEPKYDRAQSFSEGLAAVVTKGKIGFIDRSGKMIIQPKYDVASSFSEGLVVVTICETPIKRHHKFCINKTGETVFDLSAIIQKLENSKEFQWKGYAYDQVVRDEISVDSVNRPIEHAFNARFDDTQRFSDGLLQIKSREKYGYIDRRGTVVIPCKFGFALPFKEGLAPASIDPSGDSGSAAEPYGYIDKTGKFVISRNFEYASRFSEGLAFVRDKKGNGGFIDHNGKVVITVPSGFASDFHDGVTAVGEHF